MFGKIAIMFVALVSFKADAAVFKHNSELPATLKTIVAAVVNYNCELKGDALFEKKTVVTSKNVDQGVKDYFYETSFEVKDARRNTVGSVVVKSFDVNMFNPTVGVSKGVSSIDSDSVNCK